MRLIQNKEDSILLLKLEKSSPLLYDLYLDVKSIITGKYHFAIEKRIAYDYRLHKVLLQELELSSLLEDFMDRYCITMLEEY
jgi:hypothetical protein